MTHCSTHHAFPVPLSSSPAARAVCCPPGRAQSPSSSSCTTRPRAGRSHAPPFGASSFSSPRYPTLPGVVSSWQRRAALALGGPKRVGSQESGIPAVPIACCRISGPGRRPAPAAHRADPHQEEQRSPQDLSFSLVHQLTPTHSPGRAPCTHPISPPASVSPLRPFHLPCHGGWGHPGVPPGPRGQDCHRRAFRDPHFSAPNPTPEPQQHQKKRAWGGSPGSRGVPTGFTGCPGAGGAQQAPGAPQNPHPALLGLDASPALPCAGHRCPLVAPAHGSTTGPGTPGLQLDFFPPNPARRQPWSSSTPLPALGAIWHRSVPRQRRHPLGVQQEVGTASPWHQLAPRPGLTTQPPRAPRLTSSTGLAPVCTERTCVTPCLRRLATSSESGSRSEV